MRAENQLFAAQQTVIALSSQLPMAEQRLVSIEDLIGEVRTVEQAQVYSIYYTVL